MGYNLGCPPDSQDAINRHHQDDMKHFFFKVRGSQPKPSFATGILGGGGNPSYNL